ncbi:hypothetical protein V5O48_003462 [Marasmius crinis-equi]|uniref:F-box domain-containing protein n=1 Tax=Marasmius crinis-equi TaxID=585013 RepID=A0ABR3FSR3_9AGAR
MATTKPRDILCLCLRHACDSIYSSSAHMGTPGGSPKLYSCTSCGFTLAEQKDESAHSDAILASLAKNNEPPSPADEAALRQERDENARVLTLLDVEMAQLQASMVALEKRRKRLGGRPPAYKLALNPVRRFPTEILAHIFMLCVDEEVKPPYRSLWPGQPPWVLSQVCRKWRMIALSLPQLWSTIGVDWITSSDEERDSDLPKVERLLSLSLQRARDKPLSISWSQTRSHNKLIHMLLTRSYQWQDVKLTCSVEGLEELSPHVGMFPNLTSLHLHTDVDNWVDVDSEDQMFFIFQDAPSLRRFTLSGDPMAWWLLPKFVPWEQILHFTITDVAALDDHDDDLLEFLLLMENVRVCSIELHDWILPTNDFQLSHLHTLTIEPRAGAESASFLNRLTLPALKALHIKDDFCATDAEEVLSLVDRSFCQLEELTLFGEDIICVAEDEYFFDSDVFRSITRLHLSGGKLDGQARRASVPDEVLDALWLAPPESGQWTPLPSLRSLSITGVEQWPDATLVNMLVSRRNVGHLPVGSAVLLEEILLWDTGEDEFVLEDVVAKAQLAELVEGGLVANFS